MIYTLFIDASETVLGFLGFDRTVYSNFKNKKVNMFIDRQPRGKG